jgi:hypothetical protein
MKWPLVCCKNLLYEVALLLYAAKLEPISVENCLLCWSTFPVQRCSTGGEGETESFRSTINAYRSSTLAGSVALRCGESAVVLRGARLCCGLRNQGELR